MKISVADFWKAIVGRKKSYKQTFGNPAGAAVLADLSKFCYANSSTFDTDPQVHAALEGRREVWLRIANHLNLSEEELAELYSGRQFKFLKDRADA